MSIAEKFEVIADAVYDKGKQDEYDRFWDAYQDNGNRDFYSYGFSGYGWTNENFKPKYPIITSANPNRTNVMFQYAYNLTEIMSPLYFYDTSSSSTFVNCRNLIKIGDDTGGGIWTTRNRTFTYNFSSCSNLEEIRFIDYNEKGEYVPSEIGNSIDFSYSPLSVASMINIIAHLVNYKDTDNDGVNSVKFTQNCWAALEAYSAAPDGGKWVDYVANKGWIT